MKQLKISVFLILIFAVTAGLNIESASKEIIQQRNPLYEGIKKKNRILVICKSNFEIPFTDSIYSYVSNGFLKKQYQIISDQQYTDFYKQEYKILQDKILNNVLKAKKADQFQIENQVRNHNFRLQRIYIYSTIAIENNKPVINEFKWKTLTIPQQPYDTLKTFKTLHFSDRSIQFVCNAFIDSIYLYNK
jgi:hypothetical protein